MSKKKINEQSEKLSKEEKRKRANTIEIDSDFPHNALHFTQKSPPELVFFLMIYEKCVEKMETWNIIFAH